jgi:DnaJ-class molecular chaperone
MDDVEECSRCNGSGEVALNAFTLAYKCAGPVPDDARGVVSETCARCRGMGYIECAGDDYE